MPLFYLLHYYYYYCYYYNYYYYYLPPTANYQLQKILKVGMKLKKIRFFCKFRISKEWETIFYKDDEK